MIYHFEKDICAESFNELSSALSSGDITKVVITSNGGDADLVDSFISLLSHYNIVLIAENYVCSSAWDIFRCYPGKKSIGKFFYAAADHLINCEIGTRDILDHKSFDSLKYKKSKELKEEYLAEAKKYMTNSEYLLYSKGGEVVFNAARVRKICKL